MTNKTQPQLHKKAAKHYLLATVTAAVAPAGLLLHCQPLYLCKAEKRNKKKKGKILPTAAREKNDKVVRILGK